ncbi:p21-Rho-binding domain protein [Teladorsagia circumcincta]|uniref:p21-Rho-binding domain protein n=1 Tax=Teladorsagia circumcincta TaxID=45464 RepID=A0A2G9U7K5_TELCI|nr:p21-Rho-binding domain protein [Teladorsagia circumcincta]
MDDDEKFTVPLPAPRKSSSSKIDKKSTISPPFNFRHVSHVGMDFKSEDVRRAIRPMSKLEELDSLPVAPTLASPSDGYEKVSPRSSQQSADLVDVSWYQNVSSVRSANELSIHTYKNIEDEKRRPQAPTSPLKALSEHQIRTPEKVEQQYAPSLVLERPDVLGEMKLRLDDAIPVSSSVHSQSTPAKATLVESPEVKPRTHWLSDLPAEEQKRISGLWQQATGEIEVPDDSIAVKKAIAMFEARLRNPKPPRPPPPRRHAPPPPISMGAEVKCEQKSLNEINDGKKDESAVADSEKSVISQDSEDACTVQHVTVQTVPTGGEKLLEKVNEETAEVTCIQPSVVQLPEYSVEECILNLSLIGLNTTSEASCDENRSCVSVERSEGTFVACETATEIDRRPNHDTSVVELFWKKFKRKY